MCRAQVLEVLNHLSLAREFGVDVEFVAKKRIVLRSDRQAIYRVALARTAQGDERANAYLVQNQEP